MYISPDLDGNRALCLFHDMGTVSRLFVYSSGLRWVKDGFKCWETQKSLYTSANDEPEALARLVKFQVVTPSAAVA